MSNKKYTKISGIIFAIVGLAHLLRVVLGWDVIIGGWDVPLWFSFIAVLVLAFLAYTALKLSGKK